MDVRIRVATRKDHEMIWRATMETVWNDLSSEERRTMERGAFERHFRPHAKHVIDNPKGAIFVAEAPGGAVVGYTILGRVTTMLSPEPVGFVYDLWVAPEARRRGVARRLVRHAEGWCQKQGIHKLKLEVSAGNEGARALYASAGFAEERLYLGKALGVAGTQTEALIRS